MCVSVHQIHSYVNIPFNLIFQLRPHVLLMILCLKFTEKSFQRQICHFGWWLHSNSIYWEKKEELFELSKGRPRFDKSKIFHPATQSIILPWDYLIQNRGFDGKTVLKSLYWLSFKQSIVSMVYFQKCDNGIVVHTWH